MRDNVIVGIIKVVITVIALILAVFHVIWPDLAIDIVTLTLMVIAILPWLSPILKSLELPGGLKVEFRDMAETTEKIDKAGLLPPKSEKTYEYPFLLISEEDPNLALAGLRIEIEKRLREIASTRDIPSDKKGGVSRLLRELSRREILTSEERSALADLVSLLNRAVHGAKLDEKAVKWAIEIGPRILEGLDEKWEGNKHGETDGNS
jgi:hypothetical protein